jgi:hypothetical protein
MIGNWFKRRTQIKIANAAEEDIRRIISVLKGMSFEERGAIVAFSTMVRLQLEANGIMSKGIFDTLEPQKSQEYGAAVHALADGIRTCQSNGDEHVAGGFMTWHQSLRAIGIPEITYLGQEMWREIKQGFPYAESQWQSLSMTDGHIWGDFQQREATFVPRQLDIDNR